MRAQTRVITSGSGSALAAWLVAEAVEEVVPESTLSRNCRTEEISSELSIYTSPFGSLLVTTNGACPIGSRS